MTAPILITGGTGTLGRLVTPLLRETGAAVRVLSRRPHESDDDIEFATGDLAPGAGVEAALRGVGTILHLAGSARGDDVKARTLVRMAKRSGAEHLVYISVVGADRIPVLNRMDRAMFGYFASKRAAEMVIASSGVPWTIVRATQFHDLIFTVVQTLAKSPVVPVPLGFRFQPVDASEVAARLVELASGGPAGLVPDIAGPRVYGVGELVASYVRARHLRRLIMPVPMPGRAARAVRAGATLAPDRAVGRRTWEEFLDERMRAYDASVDVAR